MQPKFKVLILTFIILLVAGVLAKPYIPFLNRAEREFSATPNSYAAYQQALSKEKPIFLEFYAEW